MKIRLISLIIALVTVITAAGLYAYPEPSLIPGPADWTLNVVFDQPRQITVNIPGDPAPKRFWYIILTLTNNSTLNDVPFYPSCDLMTDTFQIVKAGKGIRDIVFKKIKLTHQGGYPFLESLEFAGSRVLQGSDNTKDIAVIWPDFDKKAKNINLFIAGLSNETIAIDNPVETDETGKPKKIYLRKTLALEYAIAGDETLRASANLKFKSKKWVMR